MNVHRERLTSCPINVPGFRADFDTSACLSSVNVPLNNDGWGTTIIFLLDGLIKVCPDTHKKEGISIYLLNPFSIAETIENTFPGPGQLTDERDSRENKRQAMHQALNVGI
ncbi:hypothetical protein AVEN_100739-1 [Araneus ventricosus]|uniref:Uncharacterized protein n=1 Tax=Araneus ventricosus TaxID=182803 RepID=A0A4Y2CUR9_ARAVE|nr:hypothetical protein AVEN_100739-1 [Araneus ventricosus]